MNIYTHPLYYEIAFGSFDVKEQVDAFEMIIREFSKIKVRRFLDIACGSSLQLREIARRGYEAVGLDLAPKMLLYLSQKASEEGLRIEIVHADMCSFRLRKKADFAFIMRGSLAFESNERFLDHLDSAAHSLSRGGLYLMQNKRLDWMGAGGHGGTVKRKGIVVRVIFTTRWKNILNQIYTRKVVFEVNDNGRKKRFDIKEDLKFIAPQEFKALIELEGEFEFLGWWEGTESTWFLDKPLEGSEDLDKPNMVLLRKK